MKQKVLLFIDDHESFIIKSIIKNLTAKRHECVLIHLDVDELCKYRDEVDGYVFFNFSDVNEVDPKGLAYLKEFCLDCDYKLYYMGYADEIAQLTDDNFPKKMMGEFHRPLNAAEVSQQIDALVREAPMTRMKHILVVDDSGVMLNTIKEWLSDEYRITPVNSATNAITFLASNRPDLILLDYEMPVCSGPQFIQMIREDPKLEDIPVIFLTGKDDAESVKSVLALKPQGYLLKSRPKEEIKKAIHDFFEKIKYQ